MTIKQILKHKKRCHLKKKKIENIHWTELLNIQ